MLKPSPHFSTSVRSLGIDIGRCAIKSILLDKSSQGLAVRHAARVMTPPGAIENGVIVKRREVAALLRQIAKETGTPITTASLAAPTDQLIVRWIDLPEMDAESLRAATRFEARRYLPYPVDDADIDIVPSHALVDGVDGAPRRMKALLAAAPKDVVRSRAETLEMADIEVARVEGEPLAYLRALSFAGGASASLWRGQPMVHVHLGEESSGMCVMQDAQLRFSHTISWGSQRLTQALSTANGCSIEDAVAIKESDAAVIDREGALTWSQLSETRSSEAFAPELDRLRRELQRLLNYYRSLFPERSYEGILDRMVLSGGSANLKGLTDYFSAIFHAEVSVGNPLQSFSSRLVSGSFSAVANYKTSFAVAIGLALSEFQQGTASATAILGDRDGQQESIWRRKAA